MNEQFFIRFFNFVVFRTCDVHYISSIANFPGAKTVNEKILGFGNSGMENPYQKVLAGKEKFEKIVDTATTSQKEVLIEDLMQLLKQEER